MQNLIVLTGKNALHEVAGRLFWLYVNSWGRA